VDEFAAVKGGAIPFPWFEKHLCKSLDLMMLKVMVSELKKEGFSDES